MTISSLAIGGIATAAIALYVHFKSDDDAGFASLVALMAGVLFWAGYLVASIGSITISFGK